MENKNQLWEKLDEAVDSFLEEGFVDSADMGDVLSAIDELKEAYGYNK